MTGIKIIRAVLILLLLIFACNSSYAEQTIITLPSSDVLPSENMILKTSVKTGINGSRYTRMTPTAVFGAGHGINVSFGLPVKINYDSDTDVSASIGIKKVWHAGKNTRLTVGGNVEPYLTKSVTPNMFAYAHVTYKIRKTRTSLTAGGYMAGDKHFLNTGGAALGIQQVIIKNKLHLAADWMSGHNSKGNFAVGLKYRPVPDLSFTGAIIIPNKKSKNLAFQISVSKYLDLKYNKNEKNKEL